MAMSNGKNIDTGSKLSPVAAVALVIANIIGTGLFTTTGFLMELLGASWLILIVWIVGGLLAMCGATIYGELGAMMPRSGGEYIYLSRVFHPSVGFVSGWVSLLVGFSAPIALGAFVFGAYVEAEIPQLPAKLAGTVLIFLLTIAQLFDVAWGGRFTTVLTSLKVLIVLAFIAAAFSIGQGEWRFLLSGDPIVSPGAFAIALVLVSYSYTGWNVAAYVAGELQHPTQTLPRVLLWGTGIAIFISIAINVAYLYALPPVQLALTGEQVGVQAGYALFGAIGGNLVAAMIALALISSINAMIMAGPRIYATMAQDGVFFKPLAERNKKGIPWVSISFQSILSVIMLLSSTFLSLLTYVGFTLSLFSVLSVLAVFVLRRREPNTPRPYQALGWPYSGILFLAVSGLMIVYAIANRPLIALTGLLTILSGAALFYLRNGTSQTPVKNRSESIGANLEFFDK